jgi:hypothetical protein
LAPNSLKWPLPNATDFQFHARRRGEAATFARQGFRALRSADARRPEGRGRFGDLGDSDPPAVGGEVRQGLYHPRTIGGEPVGVVEPPIEDALAHALAAGVTTSGRIARPLVGCLQ